VWQTWLVSLICHVLLLLVVVAVSSLRQKGEFKAIFLPSVDMVLLSTTAMSLLVLNQNLIMDCEFEDEVVVGGVDAMTQYARYVLLGLCLLCFYCGAFHNGQVRALLSTPANGTAVADQLLWAQEQPPVITIRAEAYHHNTHTISTGDQGMERDYTGGSNNRGTTRTVKVVTKSVQEAFSYNDHRCLGPTFDTGDFLRWNGPILGSFYFKSSYADQQTKGKVEEAKNALHSQVAGLDKESGVLDLPGHHEVHVFAVPKSWTCCDSSDVRFFWQIFVIFSIATCTVGLLLMFISMFAQRVNLFYNKEVTVLTFDDEAKKKPIIGALSPGFVKPPQPTMPSASAPQGFVQPQQPTMPMAQPVQTPVVVATPVVVPATTVGANPSDQPSNLQETPTTV